MRRLHLGDQVYTWENGCMLHAQRLMDLGRNPGVTPALQRKMEEQAAARLQVAYRHVWGKRWCALALSHASHLMLWSDNDVTNDFTCDYNADGTQTYDPAYLRVAIRVYEAYQKQLRAPTCCGSTGMRLGAPPAKPALRQDWAYQRYDFVGVFLIDMRGNLVDEAGVLHRNPILGRAQRAALEAAFATPGIRCMLVGAEIPFVGPTPQGCVEGVARGMAFLGEHWPYHLEELTWLLDLCFSWKAAEAGREVVLLAGDIHVGVDSTIYDSATGESIRHVTTSPITNAVSPFFPPREGQLNERYTYKHTVLDGLHNYCALDIVLLPDGRTVQADVVLVGVPEPKSGASRMEPDM